MKTTLVKSGRRLAVFLGLAAAFALPAGALTVEKVYRTSSTACDVQLSYAAAASDRAVLVAWGSSDAGATFTAWPNCTYAEGFARANTTACCVTLPSAALSAAYLRFFLVPDDQPLDWIETDGTQFIRTDFYPGPTDTTILADFLLKATTPVQQRMFGTPTGCGLVVQAYINGSGGWSWSYSNAGNWTSSGTFPGVLVQTVRTQVLLDGYNNKYTLTMDGVQKYTCTISSQVTAANRTGTPSSPLNIFANAANVDQYGRMRLYSLTCSRNGTAERNFVPHVRRGVMGVRDSVTGRFFPRTVGNMFLGSPASAAASETSAAVSLGPVKVTSCYRSSEDPGTVDISFAASSSAREVWYAWDDADKGATFSAWAHNERLGTLAANATYGHYHLPPGSKGFAKGRIFLLASGGSYNCTYIRGEGRQCIDTGILTGTNVCISADIRMNSTLVAQRAFGVDDSDFTMTAYVNGSGYWAWSAKDTAGNWTATTVLPRTDVRTQITLDCPNDRYTLSHDGQQVYTVALSSVAAVAAAFTKIGNVTLALLAGKPKNGLCGNCAYAELYGASVQTNGVAARTFSPCVVNGVALMRDAVTDTTFGNGVTNTAAQFIPGGRLDAPAALAVGDALDLDELAAATMSDDVMADAAFWVRDFSGDLNGNGLVDDNLNEGGDFLGRNTFTLRAFGPSGHKPVFSNEFVRMPGRSVGRQMGTVYLPQPIVYTNEAQTVGLAYPTTIQLHNALTDFDNHYTLIMRVRPDFTTPCNNTQWLAHFAHGGGRGLMFGFTGTGTAKSRKLAVYIGGTSVDVGSIYSTNGWCDIAMIADERKLTCMLMRDWKQTGETTGATQIKTLTIPTARELKPNHADFLIGAESATSSARPYPMGANDNSLKCFRGSIAQVAAWRRTLSTEEVYRALGWPKTDIWRVGVQDGKAGPDYAGERPAGGFDVDGSVWPLADGLGAGQSVTFKFPLDAGYETDLPQFLRWKSLDGSAKGFLNVNVNGKNLQSHLASPGKWMNVFVPANQLRSGTNTLVVTRTDAGAGAVIPDTVVFGGGWQVGKVDTGYSEFGQEWSTKRDFYVADGNLRDFSRVIQSARSPTVTNVNLHFSMPAELAGFCRWRLRVATVSGVYPASTGSVLPLRVDLNGRNVFAQDVKTGNNYPIELEAEDIPAGQNLIKLMNAAPDLGNSYYIGFNAIILEPIRPADGTILIMR